MNKESGRVRKKKSGEVGGWERGGMRNGGCGMRGREAGSWESHLVSNRFRTIVRVDTCIVSHPCLR